MKLLLDSHTFLWLIDGNPKLGRGARTALNDMRNLLYLSVVSIWELAIKTSRVNLVTGDSKLTFYSVPIIW